MTKFIKSFLISFCGVFAFIFASFFFVGCGIDYSKINLVADKTQLTMMVGDSEDVTLTIEGYQQGFSNKVDVEIVSDGAVFTCSDPIYLAEDEIRLSIKADAGGSGQIVVKTFEAQKRCSIDIQVLQNSSSLEFDNTTLYVSNSTAFVPNSSYFNFDPNTTNKDLTFYYFEKTDLNFNTYKLVSLENSRAIFSDGTKESGQITVSEFEQIKLTEGNDLILVNGKLEKELVLDTRFCVLAVYDASVNNEDYEQIVSSVATVYVLPDIDLEITGGYVDVAKDEVKFGNVENNSIDIIPNNPDKVQYALKIKINNAIIDKNDAECLSQLSIRYPESNCVNVEFDSVLKEKYSNGDDSVYYIRISQNSQIQAQTSMSFSTYYNIAREIEDSSVNLMTDFNINVKIAPTALMVNGTTEPDKITLYNFYKLPDFGWNELMFDVISGFETSPNFDGLYFTYDEELLDLTYNGVNVVSGNSKLYSDLSTPFYIRGMLGIQPVSEVVLEAHLVCEGLLDNEKSEIVLPIKFEIKAGAQYIATENTFADKVFYLDYNDGCKPFNAQIYADKEFQYIISEFSLGQDIVKIELADSNNPYIKSNGSEKYYLNLKITPLATGTGIYTVYLDNGMFINLTFNVIKTLKSETTSINLLSEGNEAVAWYSYDDIWIDETHDVKYDASLNLEILNPSSKKVGNTAHFSIEANLPNANSIESISIGSSVLVSKIGDYYRLTTTGNGDTLIDFTLSGVIVEAFKPVEQELKVGVNVSSYSLVEEFYLKNGEARAINNVVYYDNSGGRLNDADMSVTFMSHVESTSANNFYKYSFVKEAFVEIFENATKIEDNSDVADWSYEIKSDMYESNLVHESYKQDLNDLHGDKFLYFYVQDSNGDYLPTTINATVTRKLGADSETKTIALDLPSGIMFRPEDFTATYPIIIAETGEEILAEYDVKFENVYYISTFAEFNIETFTYKSVWPFSRPTTMTLISYLKQRNPLDTNKFEAKIVAQEYQEVESISLASSLTQIDFTNEKLEQTVGVFTFPTTATNSNVKVQFVKSSGNPYADMLTWKIEKSEKDPNVYMVTLSCEDFYKRHKSDIQTLVDELKGKVYIFPAEWGNSYTTIEGGREPLCIDVHYRNGSRENPYLLETAEDVLAINANETTLKSHYEIRTTIDLSQLKNVTPIGILNDKLVGFSGSIVGTNSQAGIIGINISDTNFVKEIDVWRYAGLFAQINSDASIENISATGKFDFDISNTAVYAGLLAAVNRGELLNSGAKVNKSDISCIGGVLCLGGLVGINYGNIVQDFTKFENTNQNTRNLAYFNDFVNIDLSSNTKAHLGGVVGVSYGVIERITSSTLKLYGYAPYSAFTLIYATGKDAEMVAIGGVAGALYISGGNENYVKNLLVGGELSSFIMVGERSYVGGLVGHMDTENDGVINIVSNTVRTFLRGEKYVGAFAGYDGYANYSSERLSNFSDNIFEAVDDGRNAFYSASIIKTTKTGYEVNNNDFFAIGNYGENSRDYKDVFEINSYVARAKTVVAENNSVLSTSNSTTDYYGDYLIVRKQTTEGMFSIIESYSFTSKEVDLQLQDSNFKMYSDKQNANAEVYFMYYFDIKSKLSGEISDKDYDNIEKINNFNTSSEFYPFIMKNADVTIESATPGILAVDINGNFVVKGTGLAVVNVKSILNTVKNKVIYVYVVNYFDANANTSLFYTSANMNGASITNDSILTIFGNTSTSSYLVPNYSLAEKEVDGLTYHVSDEGLLMLNNVGYQLAKNSEVSIDCVQSDFIVDEHGESILDEYFSSVQINKQTIVFYKNKDFVNNDGYTLTPILKINVKVGDENFEYYYRLEDVKINIDVRYRESTTSIKTNTKNFAMKTNNSFKDVVTVESTNEKEMIFYEIFKDGVLVQSRVPTAEEMQGFVGDESKWLDYINYLKDAKGEKTADNKENLFNLKFDRRGDSNIFDFACSINTYSDSYKNRYQDGQSIFGDYVIHLYGSELAEGVVWSFNLTLDEADIDYITINNYSDFRDISLSDAIVVPSQRGLLEILVDPVEAVFDRFEIKNNVLNFMSGANTAGFSFAYEKIEGEDVEIVENEKFLTYENGVAYFTYDQMIQYFENHDLDYTGKIYIAYNMPATNVEDGVDVGFDVSVYYGNEGEKTAYATKILTTKLGTYAKLEIVDKQEIGDFYYVARGMKYELELDYYGYSEDQITISITKEDRYYADVVKVDGKYVLQITSESINYEGATGKYIDITTKALKVVDGNEIPFESTLSLCIMEYVVNYNYQEEVFEDIVKGMENGIIYTAIGNPYDLEFDITDFLEYNSKIEAVRIEVADFIAEMTKNIKWKIYYDGEEDVLADNKTIRTDYYSINSLTFTPLKVYNANANIYYLSAEANYEMKNGKYAYSKVSIGSFPIYTEFSFEVHDQSTEESPIPIRTYQELINMNDGEHYILLNNIDIPNATEVLEQGLSEFSPINTEIKSLDGNGYNVTFGGEYAFSGQSNIGLFGTVAEGAVLKNITIQLDEDVLFRVDSTKFNVGLLTAINNGQITNCESQLARDTLSLSVICANSASGSYVAGLVGANAGYITNSRSEVSILCNVHLSGFVGQNTGLIASSYYKGMMLKNETNTTNEFTAGFAIVNSGEIYTSYASRKVASGDYFEDDIDNETKQSRNTLQSNYNVTGFVYTNSGEVEDCYSSLQFKKSGAHSSGFVYENSGAISRCFSTSILQSYQASNYGFVRENASEGKITDCFYLKDDEKKVNVNIGVVNNDANVEIGMVDVEGFKRGEDGTFNSVFDNFVIAKGNDANAVWFYNDKTIRGTFNAEDFYAGRIDLVSANVEAYSNRTLDRIESITDEFGVTRAKYVYVYSSSSKRLGSMYNPILIGSAENMEEYILRENTRSGNNYSYYRLICDIDYSDYNQNSKLFKTKFLGYLEGNFMNVSNFNLVSSEALTYAGLFAEIGKSTDLDSIGTVMNVDLNPSVVSFANASVVGALAGKVDNAKIANVTIGDGSVNGLVVSGLNVVGGVVGLSVSESTLDSVVSNVSAKARSHVVLSAYNFSENDLDYDNYSYAGTVVGVVSGATKLRNSIAQEGISVLASRAGLMFGCIDKRAIVTDVTVMMNADMSVNAYLYGGLVVGESRGSVSKVEVVAMAEDFNGFKKIPSTPVAIGGFAGVISGGNLEQVAVHQSIVTSTLTSNTGVEYLGGITGMILGSVEMKDVVFDANLTGYKFVGGIAGIINSNNQAKFMDITVNSNGLQVVGHNQYEVGIGGLAGKVEGSTFVDVSASEKENASESVGENESRYNANLFKVNALANIYVYNQKVDVYLGAIIGKNDSTLSMNVNNSQSQLMGLISVEDMSLVYDDTSQATCKVEMSAESGEESEVLEIKLSQNGKIFASKEDVGENNYTYCNVTFNSSGQTDGGSGQTLYVNLIGNLFIPEEIQD